MDPYRESGPDVRVAARELAPSRGSSADDDNEEEEDGARTPVRSRTPARVPPDRRPPALPRAARTPEVLRGRRAGPEGTTRGGCRPGSARPGPLRPRCGGGVAMLSRATGALVMLGDSSARVSLACPSGPGAR